MITSRLKPRLLALIALVIGVLLLVATVTVVLLLVFSDGENRRTISRFWALAPVMGVAGILAVALALRAAFRKVCVDCGERVDAQSEIVFAAEDSSAVIRMLRAGDWNSLRAVAPVKFQKPNTTEMMHGTVVVQTNVCVGCGRAGTVRAYKAGESIADRSTVLERREAPGPELKSLAATRAT
ncbi:hypothetical protein BH09ACT6_BH09ACT6_11030 [soil metagenome]